MEDSRLLFQSPAGIAGQATGSAVAAQCAGGSAEHPSAEVEIVSSAAGSAGAAVQGPAGAAAAVCSGSAVSAAKSRARSVEPTMVPAAETPPERCEWEMRERCPENDIGGEVPVPGKKGGRKYPPCWRSWCAQMA
eukprot:9217834-Pyramimonas_sp.AAC.1